MAERGQRAVSSVKRQVWLWPLSIASCRLQDKDNRAATRLSGAGWPGWAAKFGSLSALPSKFSTVRITGVYPQLLVLSLLRQRAWSSSSADPRFYYNTVQYLFRSHSPHVDARRPASGILLLLYCSVIIVSCSQSGIPSMHPITFDGIHHCFCRTLVIREHLESRML